ncbi:MAG: argininosuccinate lyase [Betaproteobacteria bacterium]|nr:argininosuccinate lyase [Betaproteobacteria bacterium]
MFKLFQQFVDGILVNNERALTEVHADYSTTTEIADALLQRSDVPFRIGHHFASKLTDHGRGLWLQEIPYPEAARLYEAQTKEAFPLSEADFSEVTSAEYMVFGRKGIGGPQLTEVNRMLCVERDKVAVERAWLTTRSDHLARAEATLEQDFASLASRCSEETLNRRHREASCAIAT